MTTFIYIAAYVLLILEIIWWFTCVERKGFPFLLELCVCAILAIPGLHCFSVIISPVIIGTAIEDDYLYIKDNWFNRNFLGYRG